MAGEKGWPGVSLISPVEGGQQGEDLGSGAKEPGVPGHAPRGPGVFVVDLAENVASGNEAGSPWQQIVGADPCVRPLEAHPWVRPDEKLA